MLWSVNNVFFAALRRQLLLLSGYKRRFYKDTNVTCIDSRMTILFGVAAVEPSLDLLDQIITCMQVDLAPVSRSLELECKQNLHKMPGLAAEPSENGDFHVNHGSAPA
jgi:hypothetical protein